VEIADVQHSDGLGSRWQYRKGLLLLPNQAQVALNAYAPDTR
jgi:hypothetical protein